jgi:hypothetical protein
MAIGAVEFLVLTGERMIDQRDLAVAAFKAFLVPMSLFVRQVLRVAADRRLALFATVGEQRFVALDTEQFLIAEDVPVPGQIEITVETGKHSRVTAAFHL